MRYLITPLVVISAGIFYAIGFGGGVIAAILAAVVLETLFWTQIVRSGRPMRNR